MQNKSPWKFEFYQLNYFFFISLYSDIIRCEEQSDSHLQQVSFKFSFRFFMVFLCLGLSVFSTIEDHEYEDLAETSLFYLEVLVVVWFGIEFIVRLWSSGCRSRYQGWIGRLRFMKSPFCIIGVVFL